MSENAQKEVLHYLQNVSVFLLGILCLGLPIVFSTMTTNGFDIPKQLLVGGITFITLLTLGIRMVIEGKVRVQRTPFTLPVTLFGAVLLISAILSINRYDSLMAYVPMLFALLLFFVVVNTIKDKRATLFLIAAFLLGSVLSGAVSILSFFKIYVLPIQATHNPAFTTYGTLFDQVMYLAVALSLAAMLLHSAFTQTRKQGLIDVKTVTFGLATLVIGISVLLTSYMLVTTHKTPILPFETGFQTAFAAISQDEGRIATSFFVGSGFGTYMTDFTRFKSATYNLHPTLWNVTFIRSSSFVLELLATTGLFGILTFGFILYRIIRERQFFLPLVTIMLLSVLLPFSATMQTLIFLMLALYAVLRAQESHKHYPEVIYNFVTLQEGLLSATEETTKKQTRSNRILPGIVLGLIIAVVGYVGYYTGLYVMSDIIFQRSAIAAGQNNGLLTYNLQRDAINMFPYKDTYHRVFSQTNLALAEAVATQLQKTSSPSAQAQQQIINLTQQAINTGRNATTLAPLTVTNWNSLSSLYRSLIGFGENAERFAVATNQQAIALDNTNPQQYINLGGIYYQLQAYDDAQRQFQIAVNLKQDLANGYYSLGKTLEAKGDFQNALVAYQTTKTLVTEDKESTKVVEENIKTLQTKVQKSPAGQDVTSNTQNQPPLGVPTPPAQLPERDPRVEIPAPSVTPLPSPTPSPTEAQEQ